MWYDKHANSYMLPVSPHKPDLEVGNGHSSRRYFKTKEKTSLRQF